MFLIQMTQNILLNFLNFKNLTKIKKIKTNFLTGSKRRKTAQSLKPKQDFIKNKMNQTLGNFQQEWYEMLERGTMA